ncbi:hypothetical protein ACJJTC_013406 [Scirpophaga incertulas]
MCKCSDIVLIVIVLTVSTIYMASPKEKCDTCVPAQNCGFYRRLNQEAQLTWQSRFICPQALRSDPLPPDILSTNFVCCPENIWGLSSSESANEHDNQRNAKIISQDSNVSDKKSNYGSQNSENPEINERSFRRSGNSGDNLRLYDNRRKNVRAKYIGGQPSSSINNPYFIPKSGNSSNTLQRSITKMSPRYQRCPITKIPPEPESGCCGIEATLNANTDRTTRPNNLNSRLIQGTGPQRTDLNSFFGGIREFKRNKRDTAGNVTVGNRIAGGKETDLTAFPWTVLLKAIFTYAGTKDVAFACGGSLISSRFVLTAGHCLFDANGPIKQVEVNLAEYDKRTFPRDCKFVLSRGEVCVDNIVMQADKFILHPEYNDDQLLNDIALIRLRGNAPFTDYIRPICLPTVDVDTPELSNLRLAVAGWGRNGRYKSDIKQSTIVNLVPQQECKKSYPTLTRRQVCAAGYSGEDTCKGDSGGPLMLLYNEKYYISGVISGKRADAPCGTSVPSLYTNVYQYVTWIRSVINSN